MSAHVMAATPTKQDMRSEVRYELDPPACRNCKHLRVVKHPPNQNGERKRENHCHRFAFRVRLGAICDHWKGHHGETLE